MKLLFIGINPSKAFQKTVVSHGFSCAISEKFVSSEKKQNYEMVVVSLKQVKDLKQLETIRKKFPVSWICAVIHKTDLDDPAFYSALIENEFKNTVWLADSWESTFWFSYQQMLESQSLTKRSKNLETELSKVKAKTVALSESSNKLLEKFKKDVDLAENIQRVLRPRSSPQIPGISLSVKFIPSLGGGGDYYDIFEFGDKKRFGVLLADSKSHGMAAALLSVLLKLRLEEMKDRFPDSKSFVRHVNNEIRSVYNKNETTMSLLYGILDRASLTFQFTSAGDLHPILWRRGNVEPISQIKNPEIGGVEHFEFREQTIKMLPGDLMVLYTLGLEAPIKKRSMSGEERIVELLKSRGNSPEPLSMQNELMGLIDEYTSKKKLKDDVTLIQLAVDERAMYVAKAEGD
jgi:serine phosphatase RsbU (regulator of sigma subunit)